MSRSRLLLLLVIAIVAVANDVNAAEDHSIRLEHEQKNSKRQHLDGRILSGLTNELRSDNAVDESKATEKRGIISSLSAKARNVIKKNTGLTNKLESLEKIREIAVAVAKSPSVKKLETAAMKDPNFFAKLQKNPEPLMKLAKDSEAAKISTALEKNSVQLTKKDINNIRTAVADDPVKASKVGGLKAFGWLFAVVAEMGITGPLGCLFMKAMGGIILK